MQNQKKIYFHNKMTKSWIYQNITGKTKIRINQKFLHAMGWWNLKILGRL